jgi:hypothetical protein
MCCCSKPTINGEIGYKWQPNDASIRYPLNPPTLQENDTLLYDEPGRCGGVDSHSYHYRVVKVCGSLELLVCHGGGEERIRISCGKVIIPALATMDSNVRYWVLNAIFQAYSCGKRYGCENTKDLWQRAAAEKRIKTRKMRNSNCVKVSIEPAALPQSAEK